MESIFALMSFAFVMSITPGPNNVLLLSSGLRFGIRRTLPHMLGIQFGMAAQLALSAYGIGVLVMETPMIATGLRWMGTAYLLYLAWQLRNIRFNDSENDADGKPFTFVQAVLFQFINPKAWVMSVTAGALLIPNFDTQWLSVVMLCVVFCLVGAPSSGSWAFFGSLLKQYMKDPVWLRNFNSLLIVMTLFTAFAIWIE